jgi:hypothetical protein
MTPWTVPGKTWLGTHVRTRDVCATPTPTQVSSRAEVRTLLTVVRTSVDTRRGNVLSVKIFVLTNLVAT